MIYTLEVNDDLKVHIVLLIQLPVPNVFDHYQTEGEIHKFSLSFLELLKSQYKIDDILLIRAANKIKGENVVACLMGLNWRNSAHNSMKLNLLWFQEGYSFPINPDVEREIRRLSFEAQGILEDSPF